MSELEEFRASKDAFFGSDPHSPLSPERRRSFSGLRYFPEDPSLALTVELDTDVDRAPFEMATSTGDAQTYRRAGLVHFEVGGEAAQVTLYAGGGSGELFLPFRDATSGKESYGAGRYLDIEAPHHGTVHVDFNLAYNPNCAYDSAWSCPLPPGENWLTVPIRAGERAFES